MRRKIIQQGLGGNTISLPKQWVDHNKLHPGDEVDVLIQGNDVIVKSGLSSVKKIYEIELSNKSDSFIRSLLASLYKAGYDEITLQVNHSQSVRKIHSIVNGFSGMEIIEQTSDVIRIRILIKVDEEEIHFLIKKMFQMILYCAKEIEQKTTNVKEQEQLLKANIRKIRDYCLRAIHVTKYQLDKSYDYYDMVTILEKIAAVYLIHDTHSINKINVVNTLLEECYHAYLKKEFNSANRIWERIGKEKSSDLMMWLLRHLSSRIVSISI